MIDIVRRLRADHFTQDTVENRYTEKLQNKAADEIERLRAEVDVVLQDQEGVEKLATENERLRAAGTEVVNFAWSAVSADCPEATDNLNRLLANLRAALGEAKDE